MNVIFENDDDDPWDANTLIDQGWAYHDIPQMTKEYWDLLLGIIGNENICFLTKAIYTDKQNTNWYRGQVLVSPKGVENLKSWKKSN